MSQRLGVKTASLKARVWLVAGLAGLAGVLASCSGLPGASSSASAAWPKRADVQPTAAFTAEGLAALDARMKEAVDKGQVAGLEYVLIKDGKVAAFNVFGEQSIGGPPMTEDSLFRIRSMTKPVAAVAMMQLYEKGVWKPEDPINKFIPELGNLKVATSQENLDSLVPANRPPTVDEVLTHRSGFGYGLSAASAVDREFQRDNPHFKANLTESMKRLAEIPLLFQPGERWSYSYGIDVTGAMIERVSGMSLGDYLDKNIFSPLGMDDTGFFVSEEAYKTRLATVYTRNAQTGGKDVFPDGYSFTVKDHSESAGGGLISTTHDYARFAQMLLNDGELDGKRILKPESVKLMMTSHIGGLRAMGGGGFGWGGAIQTNLPSDRSPLPLGAFDWFGIDGTWFWVDPANGIAFVGMIQRRGGAGPGAINLRGESAQLVYKALVPATK